MTTAAKTYQDTALYVSVSGTWTELLEMKSTPAMGLPSPNKIDVTHLKSHQKEYIKGLSDPATLDFKFNAMAKGTSNSNQDIMDAFGDIAQSFKLIIPRLNTQYLFSGQCTVETGEASPDAAGELILHIILSTDVIKDTIDATYAVTYDANGGTGTITDASSPYASGATVTVKANTFTYTGKTFLRFNTQADGLGVSYEPGATFQVYKTTVLYAVWLS